MTDDFCGQDMVVYCPFLVFTLSFPLVLALPLTGLVQASWFGSSVCISDHEHRVAACREVFCHGAFSVLWSSNMLLLVPSV